MKQVKDIMTKDVKTVSLNTTIKETAKLLFENHLTGVPVLDHNEEVVGIITEADLIMRYSTLHFPEFIQLLEGRVYLEKPEKIEEQVRKILGLKASDIMTKRVITVSPDASLESLATLIKEEHINPVPVVKDKKLVGIVSRADLVKLIAEG